MIPAVILKNKKYYIFEGFFNSRLVCAFSTRGFKNISLFYGDTKDSLNNRKVFLSELGIDYRNLVCAQQIHGSRVEYIKETDKGKGALAYETAIADTDALITDKRNLPLAIFTADCLPIFLFDSKTLCVGLIHAGWRNTKDNIVSKTLETMRIKFNTQTENLFVGFGPAIRSCCYEVGEEFKDFFSSDTIKRSGRNYLDLVSINKRQLLDSGVQEINIFDSNLCTSCKNEEFFSYRKEGNSCGRMMSVIMLK